MRSGSLRRSPAELLTTRTFSGPNASSSSAHARRSSSELARSSSFGFAYRAKCRESARVRVCDSEGIHTMQLSLSTTTPCTPACVLSLCQSRCAMEGTTSDGWSE